MTDNIADIARGLTDAQRRYLTTAREWRDPTGYYGKVWMTFPPSNTHRVLQQKGMMDRAGQISPLGMQVRAHLENKDG